MKKSAILILFLCEVMGMFGWSGVFEFSHTMSALGKDSVLRLGMETPSLADFSLAGYGECNVFAGIPKEEKFLTTRIFLYYASGVDILYANKSLEDFVPYARFGIFWVWPSPEMSSTSQETGLKAGVGMRFFPWKHLGFNAGVDFLGLLANSRADKIMESPVYHQGIQLTLGARYQW